MNNAHGRTAATPVRGNPVRRNERGKMNPERARYLIARKHSPASVERRIKMQSAIWRKEEERLNAGRWTVRFTVDDSVVCGLDCFEDCLQLAQDRLGSQTMDWEEGRWSDGLPPLHEARCFHSETRETVALFYRDYK